MELINFYTREVGRHLPEKMRADIENEIRSIIEDNLEDESQKAGRAPDEAMLVDVLQRLGPPDKVAASYLPPRYLIGPELFPHYLATLRLVISIVLVVAVIGIGLSFATGPNEPLNIIEVFARIFGGVFNAILSSAGIVTLIFAILQFTSPNFRPIDKPFDPRDLRAEPDPENVSITSAVTEVAFTLLALVIFNAYPQWIGLNSIVDGEWVHVPVLSETFFSYLPLFNLLWGLEIAQKLWLVAQGRWTRLHRAFEVGLSLLSIAILAWMLTGPNIFGLSAQDLARLGWELPSELGSGLQEGLQISFRLVLGLAIVGKVIDLGKQLFKLLRTDLPQVIMTR